MDYGQKFMRVVRFLRERDIEVNTGLQGNLQSGNPEHFVTIPKLDQVNALFLHSFCAEIFLAFEILPCDGGFFKILFTNVSK